MNTKNYDELVHIKPKMVREEFLQRKVEAKENFFVRGKAVKEAFYARHRAKAQELLHNKPQRVKNDFFSSAILAKNNFWLRNNQKIKDIKFKIFVKPKEDYKDRINYKIAVVRYQVLGIRD